MKFTLPELPYKFDALEPWIDAKTMEVHYTKHHQAYTDKLNAALEKHPEINKTIREILSDIEAIPEDIRTAVKNNGGGFYNHSLFWAFMAPNAGGKPSGDVEKILTETFGSFDVFKTKFTEAATNHFGSGWAWLVKDAENNLKIITTANQDSPISQGLTTLLGVDVWEHAYYLKYQNKRAEYLENWWNTIDWSTVNKSLNL